MLRYKLNLNLSITCKLPFILASFSSNISGKVVDQYKLNVEQRSRDIIVITIDHQVHLDYGLAYPITYEFYIPNQGDEYSAYMRHRFDDDWIEKVEKTSNDFFNGIEAVRFDYIDRKAYVSVGFSSLSDSIYIMFEDGGIQLEFTFSRISSYYDNRDAVVTSTTDDWADWCHEKFIRTCRNFRDHNLWLSCSTIGLNGDHVRKIINQKLSHGEYVMTWDGRDDLGRTTPAGIYFLPANDGHLLRTRKMVLIK